MKKKKDKRPVNKRITKNKIANTIAVLLVLVIAFCISGTVASREAITEAEQERYYREKEQELVRDTRLFLKEIGYENSGVTLKRVTDENGRQCTVMIHHDKIDRMCREERQELKYRLEEQQKIPLDFGITRYEFLIR